MNACTIAMIKRTSERINASNHEKKRRRKEEKRRELNRLSLTLFRLLLNNSTHKKTMKTKAKNVNHWTMKRAQKNNNKNRQAQNKTFHWFILVDFILFFFVLFFCVVFKSLKMHSLDLLRRVFSSPSFVFSSLCTSKQADTRQESVHYYDNWDD